MSDTNSADFSYFPGCSLATTAKESNQSLIECCRKMGINLVELADWNCCGSSSAIASITGWPLTWPAATCRWRRRAGPWWQPARAARSD